MNIELIIGIILSGVISLFVYNYIGSNFEKLIKIIYFVFMPIGMLIWIHEIFMTHSISFSQIGVIYLSSCLFFVILSNVGKIIHEYLNVNSPRTNPVLFLYFCIFGLSLYAYLYIVEK